MCSHCGQIPFWWNAVQKPQLSGFIREVAKNGSWRCFLQLPSSVLVRHFFCVKLLFLTHRFNTTSLDCIFSSYYAVLLFPNSKLIPKKDLSFCRWLRRCTHNTTGLWLMRRYHATCSVHCLVGKSLCLPPPTWACISQSIRKCEWGAGCLRRMFPSTLVSSLLSLWRL